MSNSSPLIEEQHRFARSQTPESPRPVHVPEPANIPILRNQMDPIFNDTATYNIPSDQNFSHYGETLENPNYRNTPMEENMEFKKFFLEAENQIAHSQLLPNASEPNANASVAENPAASAANHTNPSGLPSHSGQAEIDPQPIPTQPTLDSSHPEHASSGQDVKSAEESVDAGYVPPEDNGPRTDNNPDTGQTAPADAKPDDGVDYQSLLDTISQSASTAPPADTVTALTTEPSVPDTSQTSSLPSFPGLPPKPPPLQTQSASTFSSSLDLAQYIPQPNAATGANQNSHLASASGYDFNTNGTKSSTNNLEREDKAVPNPFDVGMTNEQAIAMHMQNNQSHSKPLSPSDSVEPADRPWSAKTQAIYDTFLEDERRYVTEGIWDRFPLGSRLFVGNLPSEKVTKRDLFHRFHRFGKLAQISIKQAYGFVQYHDASSCKAALDAEQGVELRGRKVHLEVSKPQKNTKGAGASSTSKPQPSQPQNNNNNNRRRSRSPPRRSYSDFRDEPSRRREEYRSRRSPSPPRGYRRDDRTVSRNGPRSPMYGSNYSTPQPAAYDDEASLPYPRRDPRNVPDVQLIVVDTVDQAFINWIEDGFKRKGLQAATTWLNQRTPLPAVVKRQIVEGVQAVVKISSSHQVRSRIPLQVFDRGAGSSNVTFNEYADLDVPVAADLVLQARRRERGGLQPPPPPPQYPPSLYQPQSPYQVSPNTSTGTASPWGPPAPPQFPSASQQHLHPYQNPHSQQTYRPPPQSPYLSTPQSATGHPPNLQDLLANLKGGTAPPTPQSAHSAGQPHTPYGQPPQQFPYGHPPQPPQYGQYPQPPAPQQQPGQPHNVQHIMDQLARYQR